MSKFSFFSGNPTNKTVTGTAHMWGLLIANHLDQSLSSINQKYSSNLLHSFFEVHKCVAPFTSQGKLHAFDAEKLISWAKPAHFDFFTINFPVWSHILRTIGDALSIWPNSTLIILFSKMLKFLKIISSKSKNIVKEIVDI
jgi:hypothetical protein